MQFNYSITHTAGLWCLLVVLHGLLQGCSQVVDGKVTKDLGANDMITGPLLHQAAYSGTLEEVTAVLDRGVDPNEQNSVGHTPLHLAAARGRVKVVALLLQRGAYINAQNSNALTPLHLAIKYGQRTTIDLLLRGGANPELRGRAFGVFAEQVMPLHQAASQDNAEVVSKLILLAQADVNARSMDMGLTPLHYASSHNGFETAILLLGSRANINAHDREGETPLHYAVRAGAREVTELLLKMGADVDVANNNGITPLQLATERNADGMGELLQVYSRVNTSAP